MTAYSGAAPDDDVKQNIISGTMLLTRRPAIGT